MFDGIILSLLAQVSYASSDILQKNIIKKINPSIMLFLLFVVNTAFTFIILKISGQSLVINISIINLLIFVFICVSTYLGHLSLLKAFKNGQVGVVMAVATSYVFWTYFLNIYLLPGQEQLSITRIFLGILFFGATIVFSIEQDHTKKIRINKSIIFAFGQAIGRGIYFCGTNYFIKKDIMSSYQIAFYVNFLILLMTIFTYIFFAKDKKSLVKAVSSRRNIAFLVSTGIVNAGGDLLMLASYRYIAGNLSNVIGLSGIIFSAILAYFFLNEKLNKKEMSLMIICLFLLFLFIII